MTQESQVLDPYEVVLIDLRAKRDKIDQAIRAIEDLRGESPAARPAGVGSSFSPVPDEGPGAFLGLTMVDATKKLLAARRKALPNAEIVAALEAGGLVMNSADKLNTLGSVLMRRFNQVGDIVRVTRGVWGLQEWYGSRNFKRKAKADPESGAGSDEELVAETFEDKLAAHVKATPAKNKVNFASPTSTASIEDPETWGPVDGPLGGGVFQ